MNRIANSTIRRLSIYLRQLEALAEEKTETVSSAKLAELAAIKDTQVRKDLSFFGSFGVRGRGYSVSGLVEKLKLILGLDRHWPAVIFGAGSLGRALAGYRGFERHNIRIAGIVDTDPRKVGARIGDLVIESLDDVETIRERTGASIAVITVPASEAHAICERAIKAGFSGIVNFAPVRLNIPPEIALYSVDLSIAFEHITYKLNRYSAG